MPKYENSKELLTSHTCELSIPEHMALFKKLMDEIPIITEETKARMLELREEFRNTPPEIKNPLTPWSYETLVASASNTLERWGWQRMNANERAIFYPDYTKEYVKRDLSGAYVMIENGAYRVDKVTGRAYSLSELDVDKAITGFYCFCKLCDRPYFDQNAYDEGQFPLTCSCGAEVVIFHGLQMPQGIVSFRESKGYEADLRLTDPELVAANIS